MESLRRDLAPVGVILDPEGHKLRELSLMLHQTDGLHQSVRSAQPVPRGEWVHLAGAFDDPTDRLCLWINGVPDTAATTSRSYYGTTLTAAIGNNRWHSNYRPLNGAIDDLRIYNKALSDGEIAALVGVSGIRDQEGSPLQTGDLRVYPNPFVSRTWISFAPTTVGDVTLDAFSVLGRRVWSDRQVMGPEREIAVWDGCNEAGRKLPPGIYYIVASNGRERRSIRCTLIR